MGFFNNIVEPLIKNNNGFGSVKPMGSNSNNVYNGAIGESVQTATTPKTTPPISEGDKTLGGLIGGAFNKAKNFVGNTVDSLKVENKPQPLVESFNKPSPISTTSTETVTQPIPVEPAKPVQTIPPKQPEPITTENQVSYDLVDPLTGNTTTYDDKAKFDKANKLLDEQIAQDKIDKAQRGIADDLISSAAVFTKDMMAGNDPIKKAQFNYAIQKLGSNNQAYNAATIMKLKAAGVDPNAPGAGQAIMTQLARQSGMELADVVNKLNVESADRIVDANKYGMTLAKDIQNYRNTQRTSDWNYGVSQIDYLANVIKDENPEVYDKALASINLPVGVNKEQFIKDIKSQNVLDNGAATRAMLSDYQAMRDPFNKLGIDINTSLFAGLQKEQVSDINDRLASIQSSVSKGVPGQAEAKQKLLELQKLYPDIFQGDYSKWDPDDLDTLGAFNKRQGLLQALSSQVGVAGLDASKLTDASDWAAKNLIDPTTAPAEWEKMWSTMNADQRKQNLALAGLDHEPLTPEEKQLSLGADQVNGIKNNTNPMKMAYDKYYETASPEFKSWITNDTTGKNKAAFEQYLTMIAKGDVLVKNADGTIGIDPTKILDPTNSSSSLASLFMDWPVGLGKDGKWADDPTDWTYTGNQPKDDDNMNDVGGHAYQIALDTAWKNYQATGGKLDRMAWFKAYKPDANGNKTGDVSEAAVNPLSAAEDFDKRMADLASGKIKLNDITKSEWALVTPEKMIPLEKAGVIKSIIKEPSISADSILYEGNLNQFLRENNIEASKQSTNDTTFKGSSRAYDGEIGSVTGKVYHKDQEKDPKDIVDQQIIILNGTPYALEDWDSFLYETGSLFNNHDVRQSTLRAKNLKTNTIETIATGKSE